MDMLCFGDVYRSRRVLVTGHTGFKGSWLTAWLLGLGAEVCGYSKDVPTIPSLFGAAGLSSEIRDHRGDVRDPADFERVVRDFRPDFVFHLAAQAIVSTAYVNPLETFGSNVMGTATVLDALRRIDWPCTGVFVTSDKAYDNVEWPWGYRENDKLGGKDIYSGSKGAAELAFNAFYHAYFARGAPTVRVATVRAGNVIGGGDWAADRIVADCVRAWLNGTAVQIRSPKATRPWQHVLEPLSGYLALGAGMVDDPTLHGESFNFGPKPEQNATVVELLSSLAKIWGFDDPSLAFEMAGSPPFHEASLLKLNIDKALLRLRWEPNLSYEESMEFTGTWYRAVLKDSADARAFTQAQIDSYVELARLRQRVWATEAG